jgi:pimeloyl-ACP methyl ester carboxylesterase
LRWAIANPARITSLILDGPPRDLLSVGRSQGEITLAAYRELVRSEGIDAFRKEWLEHPLMQLHSHDARTRALVQEMVARYPGHDLRTNDSPGVARLGNLHELDVPVLIVNGEYDSDMRIGAGAELARALPQARLAVIPGAGHLSNLDNPAAYNKVLSEYVSCRAELV